MSNLPPILFEDEWMIAFNKPCGLLTSPDRWDKDRVCLTALVHTHMSRTFFNAHRLDADTSGILLFAKTKPVLTTLVRAFERRTVHKTYTAIVQGAPPEPDMTVTTRIEQDPDWPGRVRIGGKHGASSETRIVTLERWRDHALVEAHPLTGRQHQIRLHLSFIGSPIVADRFYGSGRQLMLSPIKSSYEPKKDRPERPLLGRLALHSSKLELDHPITNEKIVIEAPLPEEFEISIKYLRKFTATGAKGLSGN